MALNGFNVPVVPCGKNNTTNYKKKPLIYTKSYQIYLFNIFLMYKNDTCIVLNK